jgi:hypothetical protein
MSIKFVTLPYLTLGLVPNSLCCLYRVHFALIFPEKYSPPIRLLDPNNLDLGLQWATQLFLADVEIDMATKTVHSILYSSIIHNTP